MSIQALQRSTEPSVATVQGGRRGDGRWGQRGHTGAVFRVWGHSQDSGFHSE